MPILLQYSVSSCKIRNVFDKGWQLGVKCNVASSQVGFILFLSSYQARFIYLRPIEEHKDETLMYYFSCNSTLEKENKLFKVDCRYDEDLSLDTFASLTRNEDAILPCDIVIEEGLHRGVSQIPTNT